MLDRSPSAPPGLGRRLGEVVVHVHVDPQEEVLDDEEPVVAGDIPTRLPATRRRGDVLPHAGVVHCETGRERVHAIAIRERRPLMDSEICAVTREYRAGK